MLKCVQCQNLYPDDTRAWHCSCGAYLELEKEIRLTEDEIDRGINSLWRYKSALGIKGGATVSLGEGMTPLIESEWRGRPIFLKLDYLCPTGSYKDRGATVMISKINEMGINSVLEDSSGNAGAAAAAYCAAAGIDCQILVPENTPPEKTIQIALYGAQVKKISGHRELTARAARKAAERTYYASHNWNPFFLQGMKTLAWELWEQLAYSLPDAVVFPVGYGSILLGLYEGFRSLEGVKDLPRLIAVQAANFSPLYEAFHDNRDQVEQISEWTGETAAEGIACQQPIKGGKMLRAIRESGGTVVTVTEEEIWEALWGLAHKGFAVEPTAAVAPAAVTGLQKKGLIKDEEIIVVQLTGSALNGLDKICSQFKKMGKTNMLEDPP